MNKKDPVPNNIKPSADNRIQPAGKSWADEIKIIIDALNDLLDRNKWLFFLVILVYSGVLTKENIVNFFSALKGFTITLGFGG